MELSPWFLVWSNLTYLLPACVLLFKSWRDKLRWNLELSFFLCVGLVSAVHHWCDTPAISQCLQRKSSLYMLDLLFSYFAITMTFGPFLVDLPRAVYHIFAVVGPVLILLLLGNNIAGAVILVVLGIMSFVGSQLRGWCSNWREHWEVFPAAALFAVGIVFKTMSDKLQADEYDYIWTHSLWHMTTALAAAFLFLDLPRAQSNIYRELQQPMKTTLVGI